MVRYGPPPKSAKIVIFLSERDLVPRLVREFDQVDAVQGDQCVVLALKHTHVLLLKQVPHPHQRVQRETHIQEAEADVQSCVCSLSCFVVSVELLVDRDPTVGVGFHAPVTGRFITSRHRHRQSLAAGVGAASLLGLLHGSQHAAVDVACTGVVMEWRGFGV